MVFLPSFNPNSLRAALKNQPDSLETSLLLSQAHLIAKKPELAKNVLQEAVDISTQKADKKKAALAYAKLLNNLGETEFALKKVDQVLNMSPDDSEALKLKSRFQLMANNLKGMHETLALLKKAHPDDSFSYIQLSQLYAAQGKYDVAVDELDAGIRNNADITTMVTQIVRIYLVQNKPDQAIKRIESLIKDKGESAVFYELMSEAWQSKNDLLQAKEHLRKSIALDVKNLRPRFRLIQLLAGATAETDKTLKEINKILEMSPNNFKALEAKVKVFARNNDEKSVIETLEHMKKALPDNSFAYHQMGQIHHGNKKYKDALSEYEQALQMFSDDMRPLRGIVKVYIDQGQMDKAIARIQQQITADPDGAFAYNLLAEVRMGQKNYIEAEAGFRKAIDASPKWVTPYGGLGNSLMQRGEMTAALAIFDDGLKIDPQNASLRFSKAGLYGQTNEYDKAIEEYYKILKLGSRDSRIVDRN